jgi:hypothetical protein
VVGRTAWPIGPRLALVADGGLGLVRTTYAGGASGTRAGLSFDGRLTWAVARRVHLSAGVGYSPTLAPPRVLEDATHLVAFSLALDVHLGDYGARQARR